QDVANAIQRVNGVASAIASAVEEQDAVTRDISASVQSVAKQNDEAARAMREVSDVAEGARASSGTVKMAAETVADVTARLGEQVDDFLVGMRTDWERANGQGTKFTLRDGQNRLHPAVLLEISRDGASFQSDVAIELGQSVEISGEIVAEAGTARVVRVTKGYVGVGFRQNAASHAWVDKLMAKLGDRQRQATGIQDRAA
ncbi:MAG: hypothetical protein RIS83_2187, partial [Pseudomonadota bacterium]